MTMKIVLIVIGAITLVGIMLLIGKMTEKKTNTANRIMKE